MTTTLQDAWATLEFAFIAIVIFVALWRTMHNAAMESAGGANRFGNFMNEVFRGKKQK